MTGKQWNAEFFSDIGDPSQLAPLFNSLPEVFFFAKDLQGRFTAINNPLLRMIGVAREEVLGATDYDFFDRDLADAYRSEDMTVMETGEPVLNELWWVPNIKTGDIHWYYSSKICLRSIDERAIGIAGIMRPIGNVGELTSDLRQMSSVASYIETHYAERLTVENMAEVAQCSPRHFQRVFKRVFKTSALEHLMRTRIRHAASDLIETHNSLGTIALGCGFYDQAHFSNQFKRLRGVTPSAYRKQFKGLP
jgi:PAS domain S-box-containing protein